MVAIVTGKDTGLERSSAFVLGSQGQLGSASLGRSGEGVYVNAANGNLVITRQDEFLIGLGPDVSVNRTYNSRSSSDGDNNDGWRASAYRTVTGLSGTYGNAGTTVTRTDWDGSATLYSWVADYNGSGNGAYVAKDGAGAYDTLTRSGTTWTWTDGTTLTVETYDQNQGGRLKTAADTDGNLVDYAYDGNGRIATVTSRNLSGTTDDEVVTFTYSGANLTQLVTSRNGGTPLTRVRYTYDGSNRLTTVTVDLSPDDSAVNDGNSYVTTYTYHGGSTRVASIAQTDGTLLQISYVDTGGGDYRVSSVVQTIAAGITRTTSFDYSVAGRTTVTDASGQKTVLSYDANKNLTAIGYPADGPGATPRSVQFTYNGNGDVIRAVYGPGNLVDYDYDAHGNLVRQRDSAGNVIERDYSLKNELLVERRYVVPDPDGGGSGTPSSPLVTRYAYDDESHLVFEVSAEGFVTEHVYDTPGRRTATIRYAANAYDVSGLAASATVGRTTLETWRTAIGDKSTTERTETSYDFRGNVDTVTSWSKLNTNGSFNTDTGVSQKTETKYVYDQAGNLLQRTVLNPQAAGTLTEAFVHDGLNRMILATDFHANVTRTTFLDSRAQTVLTHANGLSEISTYNRGGELVAFSSANAGGNLVDLAGWPADLANLPAGTPTLSGWTNNAAYHEAVWATTTGPDGQPVAAIWAGQTDPDIYGGGNVTNAVRIDGAEAYEFTFYFKLSELNKHSVYFGLSDSGGVAFVENATTGADNVNPYFFSRGYWEQSSLLAADKWYKVVGYVLAEGSANVAAGSLGGVYDVATGQKVADTNIYRWNAGRPGDDVRARFFAMYGEANQTLSSYFYQPEIRQVSVPGVTAPDIRTSFFKYDALGRLRMTTDPTGRRQYLVYDKIGRKLADIDTDGSMTEYRYDANDNLIATTRYANKLNSTQLASLVDSYGNPAEVDIAALRPTADGANDRWTFQIYDGAQRLVQAIDGTGAVTVHTYDGASRLVSTKQYASLLSGSTLTALKAAAASPNLWTNPDNGALWVLTNVTAGSAADIDGYAAFQFTVQTSGVFQAVRGNAVTVAAGDTLSLTITMMGVGSVTSNTFGLQGGVGTAWGDDGQSTAVIVSGPGSVAQVTGGLWAVTGLSTSVPTRVTITRTYAAAANARAYLYVEDHGPYIVAGESTILSAPVITKLPQVVLPAADGTNDRVARNFYDADGRLTGTLDAEGYLTKIVYDAAGRKTKTIAYSGATDPAYRASGTYAQLLGSITADNAKDIHNYFLYDARGLLRATIDGEGNLTRINYNPLGELSQVVTGQKLDPAGLLTTPPTLANLASPGSAVLRTVSYERNAYGYVVGETVSLTGSATTTTTHSYDSMYRLVSTTTNSGGADPRTATQLYDLRGNVTGTLGGIGNASLPGSPTQSQIDTAYATYGAAMTYDKAGRLISSTDPNGNSTYYYYDADGRLAYQVDPLGRTVRHSYNAFGERTETYVYWNLVSVSGLKGGDAVSFAPPGTNESEDRNVLIAYNVDGTVKQTADELGNVTAYAYNAFDEVASLVEGFTDSTTRTTAMTYDRRGLLKTQVVDAVGGGKQITTSYGYDAFGRGVTLTNALGKVTTSTYDRKGRLKTQTVSPDGGTTLYTATYTYDARDNLVAVTDANGKVTRYVYDKAGRAIATIDALGGVVATSYDADGRVVGTRAYANTISVGALPLEVPETALSLPSTHAADQVTRYSYDKDGRLRFSIDALMHVVENVYDDNGNVVSTIAYDGTIGADGSGAYAESWVAGQVSALASAAGTRVARFAYDAADRLVYAIDALGQVTWSSYDTAGQLVKRVEFAALYMTSGTPSLATMNTWRSANANATNDRTTRAFYDKKGRLVYSIDALGYVTRTAYDKLGNVTKQWRYADAYSASDGTTRGALDSHFASPPSTVRLTQFAYDTAGRLVETTDPEGFKTRLELDAVGQATSSTAAFGTGAASTTTFQYDDVGRVVKQVRGSGTGDASTSWFFYDGVGRRTASVDPGNYLTVLTYDAVGNLTTERHHANAITGSFSTTTALATLQTLATTGSDDVQIARAYDAFGRLTSLTDARNSVISTGYDVLNRVTSQTEQMESGTTDDRITLYVYDHFGNAVKVTDPRGNSSYNYYDKLGRVLRQVDAEKYVTDTAYTRSGQIATVKRWANFLTGSVSEAAFPANPTADAVHDATTSFTYNKRDELTAVTDAEGYTESYTLNAYGERIQVRNKLHVAGTFDTTVTYTFDKRGLLLTETLPITTKTSGGSPIGVVNSYAYDARGNRIQMIEAAGAAEARTTTYAYDKLDRVVTITHDAVTIVNADLTSTTSVVPTETIQYDTRGNAIKQVDAGGAQSFFYYDHLGRVTAEVGPVGTLSLHGYDKNGNRISTRVYDTAVSLPGSPGGTAPAGTGTYRQVSYAYDRSNRLTTTTIAGLQTGEYASGTWSFSSADIVTTLVYDKGGNVIHQEDGRGSDTYFWYDRLGRRIAQVDAERYLTTWKLDAEGNTLEEVRFATQLGSVTAPTPTTPGTPPAGSTHANDRKTQFTYDRNGRRTKEERLAVAYTAVNASTGAATDYAAAHGTARSTITYGYNGLGLVTARSVNGDDSVYTYDKVGRLVLEEGEAFTDHQSASVTPRTAYAYDGLGNVTTVRLQAAATPNDTNDRITTYAYGAGGRLATMTDAAGFVRTYGYDRAGRLVRESYTRVKSDGSSVTEAEVTLYDVAGRAVTQTFARHNGSAWVFTDAASAAYDAVRLQYNVHGEVTGRGLTAGPGVSAVYQESFAYDAGGRLWKSNEGDGVLRFHVYDKAGNRTLTLSSTGADLSALTVSNYTASIGATGDTGTANAVTTIAVFDRRGQRTASIEPDRQRTASGTATITRTNSYNAFGEVLTETDARGYTTSFSYNAMGRLLSKVSPQVNVTAENGGVSTANPTEYYGYDLAGRLVSVIDANGHRTTRTLLAGTGHEKDGDPLVLKEFHPDGGVLETKYDIFGDARAAINEVGATETRDYDKMGRLTVQYHPVRAAGSPGNPSGSAVQLVDHYAYDGFGRRIQHWNSQFGSGVKERTDYDAKGRVAATVNYAGEGFTYAYAWNGSLATGGLGTFGGWTKTIVNVAASKTMTEAEDYFGRTIDSIDYGGHDYAFTYDLGGRLVARTNNAGESVAFTWYNTGLAAGQTGTQGTATYEYDANGNRTAETFAKGGTAYRNASATYDAMGRMTHWADTGYAGAAPASSDWEYDAAGNVRYQSSSWRALDSQGDVAGSDTTQAYWYLYDNMNRFVLTKGELSGSRGSGTIVRGAQGTEITYRADGSRATALYQAQVIGSRWEYHDPGGQQIVGDGTGNDGDWVLASFTFLGDRKETYGYTADGYLAATGRADAGTDPGAQPADTWNGAGPEPTYHGPGAPNPLATYTLDAMGRVTWYKELGGIDGSFERTNIVYDYVGRLLSETNITLRRDTPGGTIQTYTTNVTNSYSGTLLVQTLQDTLKNGSDGAVPDTLQTYSYSWWDGAIQTRIQHDRDHNGGTPDLDWDTQFTLDGSGHVSSVAINDGRDRTVSFIVDQNGMIAHRDEADALAGGDPRTLRYFFAGQQLGMVTNNGTDNLQYVASIRDRLVPLATSDTGGAFRGGSKTAKPYADFEQSYDAINGVTADDTSSPYTVNEGDTLQTIALAVWGDASLWYLIAEANGITNGTELVQGQLISLPNKVRNNRNSADTFRPYDPNEALGNLSPTSPKPTKKPKCAVLGQIAMIAIAIAITIVLKVPVTSLLAGGGGAGAAGAASLNAFMAGAAAATGGTSALAGIAGAALTGAVASAASQAFGVAVGAQDRFSFKGVAMAAISAGVSQGIGGGPLSAKAGKFLQGVSRGVLANTAMQGIGLATGLQSRFSWAGLAGAAVSGGIMAGFESGGLPRFDPAHPTLRGLAAHVAGNTFAGVFDAAARTMIDGTSFGDNVLAVLPDVIGSTIGTMAGHTIAGGRNPASDPRAAPEVTPLDAGAGGGASAGMRHYKAAAIVGKGVGPGGATPVGTAEGYPPPADEQEVVVTAHARWMKDFAMSIFGTAGGGDWFDHLYSRQGFFGSNGGGWYGSPSSSQGSSSRQPRFTNNFAIGPALLGMSDPASGRDRSFSARGFMLRSLRLTNPRARFDLSGGAQVVWNPPPPPPPPAPAGIFGGRNERSYFSSDLTALADYQRLRFGGLVPVYSNGTMNFIVPPRLGSPERARPQASWGARFLTNFLDLLPIVGTGKAFIQMGTGHDLVTGEEVSFESQALGVTPWSKIAGRIGGRVIGNAADIRVIDAGLDSGRYSLNAPRISGFDNVPGTIGTGSAPNRVFYGTPRGDLIEAPAGYVGVTALNGRGLVLLPEGQVLGNNANIIRYGEPSVMYPQGYFRYYNQGGQPLNPITGRPGTQAETHITPNYRGPLNGYPGR